mmetsp:Transcript_38844/g.94033  ORF Transcript_38844/g.94033 Transcript_38844/m.94033 type:complete len:117 (+) Transcript_38844:239-589(+)
MPPLSMSDKESDAAAAVDATIVFGGDCYRERTHGDKNRPANATVTPPMPSTSVRWDWKKTPKSLLLLVGIFFLSIDGIMSSTKSVFRYTNKNYYYKSRLRFVFGLPTDNGRQSLFD